MLGGGLETIQWVDSIITGAPETASNLHSIYSDPSSTLVSSGDLLHLIAPPPTHTHKTKWKKLGLILRQQRLCLDRRRDWPSLTINFKAELIWTNWGEVSLNHLEL